jgi:hypothetical protein
MSTIDDPQIIDYYNEEPHGVKIVERLNDEFYELQKEMEKVKKRLKAYYSFYEKHKYLRMPVISPENLEIFKEFLKDKFEYMDNHMNLGVLQDLCESVQKVSYVLHPDPNPQSENNHVYWISRKLDELTGKKNLEACEYHIKTKLGELAIEHMNWLCSYETIVEKFMEDL